MPGLREALRLEERAGGRGPEQPHRGQADQPGQHVEIGLNTVPPNVIPGPPIAWVISSIARPNSTVDTLRAQFRPWPFARAIHIHRAIGTRSKTIVSAMKSV